MPSTSDRKVYLFSWLNGTADGAFRLDQITRDGAVVIAGALTQAGCTGVSVAEVDDLTTQSQLDLTQNPPVWV